MCWEDDVILDEEVAVGGWVIEKRHALALDGLHEPGLCDALAYQRDYVSVQVGQVTREAEQSLSKRVVVNRTMSKKKAKNMEKNCYNRTHLVDPDRLFPVQTALLAPPAAPLGTTAYAQDDVAGLPIRILVALPLVHDLVALGRAAGHVERELGRVVEDLVPPAGGTLPHDDAAPPAAIVARHLRLREHPGEDLLLDDPHAAPAAVGTRVYVPVRCGARATAVIAEHALFDDELVVERDATEAKSVRQSAFDRFFLAMGGGEIR